MNLRGLVNLANPLFFIIFTPLEIMPHCFAAGFNAPLEFLTGFTSPLFYVMKKCKIVQGWGES